MAFLSTGSPDVLGYLLSKLAAFVNASKINFGVQIEVHRWLD